MTYRCYVRASSLLSDISSFTGYDDRFEPTT
jgi:hypothetical protein